MEFATQISPLFNLYNFAYNFTICTIVYNFISSGEYWLFACECKILYFYTLCVVQKMLRNFSNALIGKHVQKFIPFGLYQGWPNSCTCPGRGGGQRNAIQDFWIFPFKFYQNCIQYNSVVAHWLLVSGDHGSNPSGDKFFSFGVEQWSLDCWLPSN